MRLPAFILQRLLYLLPALLGVSLIMFVVTRVLPGNPAYMIVGVHADESTLQAVIEKMGLDRPLHEQYFTYMGNLLQGDLGTAWRTSNPVVEDLKVRFPATIELSTYSLLVAVLWGVGLGVLAAVRRGSAVDHVADGISAAGVSIPEFWLGLILILVFYTQLNIAPPPLGRIGLDVSPPETITGLYTVDSLLTGNWEALRSSLAHLALPVLTLAIVVGAPIMRMTRSLMVDALESDFVRAARAYGIRRRDIVSRHAFRNVLAPIATMIGLVYGYLLGGTVLVETVFAWPGVGKYAVDSMLSSDFAPIMAVTLFSALIYLLVYLAIDVMQFIFDPRTRS